MLSLKLCSYHLRLSTCCRTCRRQLSTSSFIMQNGAPVKRKWKTSEIETLLEWRKVTDEVFGPVIHFKSEKIGKPSGHSKCQKTIDHKFDTINSVKSSFSSVNQSASKPYDDNFVNTDSSCLVFDDDSSLFLISNYSETKHVSSTVYTKVSSSQPQGMSANNKKAEVFQKPRDQCQFKDDQVKDDGGLLTSTAELNDTFDYKWEDHPPKKTFNESHVMKEKAIAKSCSTSVPDDNLNGVCTDSISSSDLQSRIRSERLISCVLPTCNTINNDSSNCIEVSKSLPIVRKKDGLELINNENCILSFPLFFTESNRRTMMKHAESTVGRVPSVTKILQATQSPESRKILEKWEKQMIAELGEAGFAKYKADTFANGTNLHTNIELYLTGRSDEIHIRDGNEGHWQSIEPLLDCVTGVQYVEHPVRHLGLKYAGIVDCIAEFRGNPCIIEWKTSQRRKANLKSTFDNPLQLVAYLGAYNSQPTNFLQLEQCVLVIAYGDGNAADVHVMKKNDCLQYWNAWLTRLEQYRGISKTTAWQ